MSNACQAPSFLHSLLSGSLLPWFFGLLGNALTALLDVLLKHIVEPVLHMTLFDTYTLTGQGVVAMTAGDVWRYMLMVSAAVALAAMAWGAMSGQFGKMSGGRGLFAGHAEVFEGLLIYALTIVGGYFFMSTLLNVANTVTNGLFSASNNLLALMFNSPVGCGAAVGSSVVITAAVVFFGEVVAFALACLLAWIVFIWLSRQIDIIFYVGILPLTAALAITGNKRAFQWNFTEAQGAIFSQLAMAVMWWIAFLIMGSPVPAGTYTTATGALGSVYSGIPPQVVSALRGIGGLTAHAAATPSVGADILHLMLGIVAITMVGGAPRMLQAITGHQHAGVASMAMGVAAGSLLAGAARGAYSMTTGGQFLGQMKKGREDKAKATVAAWGSRGGGSGGGGGGGSGGGGATTGPAAEGAGDAAETVGGSRVGRYMRGLGQTFATGTTEGVGLTSAARAVAPHARRFGRVAGMAASMVVQPRATMGHMMRMSMGEQAEANLESMRSRVVSTYGVMSAHFNPKEAIDRTAAALNMKPEGVSKVMGIPKADGPQPKNAPPPSREQEQAAFIASMHRQRHRPANGSYS